MQEIFFWANIKNFLCHFKPRTSRHNCDKKKQTKKQKHHIEKLHCDQNVNKKIFENEKIM